MATSTSRGVCAFFKSGWEQPHDGWAVHVVAAGHILQRLALLTPLNRLLSLMRSQLTLFDRGDPLRVELPPAPHRPLEPV